MVAEPGPATKAVRRRGRAGAVRERTSAMEPEGGSHALDPDHPLFGLGYADPTIERDYLRLDGASRELAHGPLAEEIPVALVYNGWPHVVMMCTPSDVEDFALGFSLSEEIVRGAEEIERIDVVRYGQGIEVAIAIPSDRGDAVRRRGRSLVGRTGCGLCGVATVGDALRLPSRIAADAPRIAPAALWRAADVLPAWQRYNATTGSVHAAAWVRLDGELALVREDVGRHNALDKLIGAMVAQRRSPREGFALVTSRASYELVQKCAVAGIGVLAAISRPTGLAVRMAEAAGIALVALVRGQSANVYAHAERIAVP